MQLTINIPFAKMGKAVREAAHVPHAYVERKIDAQLERAVTNALRNMASAMEAQNSKE